MSELKLNKITISNLNAEDSSSVIGGAGIGRIEQDSWWTTISIISVILSTKCSGGLPRYTDRLTDKPGSQDSCGLCTPQPQPLQPREGFEAEFDPTISRYEP